MGLKSTDVSSAASHSNWKMRVYFSLGFTTRRRSLLWPRYCALIASTSSPRMVLASAASRSSSSLARSTGAAAARESRAESRAPPPPPRPPPRPSRDAEREKRGRESELCALVERPVDDPLRMVAMNSSLCFRAASRRASASLRRASSRSWASFCRCSLVRNVSCWRRLPSSLRFFRMSSIDSGCFDAFSLAVSALSSDLVVSPCSSSPSTSIFPLELCRSRALARSSARFAISIMRRACSRSSGGREDRSMPFSLPAPTGSPGPAP
mmetsp:Transcript_4028/g.12914  ORF Transcript_4028/g.12914 Transcript_4028/m.12914 type:complete len:267 (+) Transcript_4028:1090-1890(+)